MDRGIATPLSVARGVGRSGFHSRFTASTASWIATLMPTPAMGDMACAASPRHSTPGRYQRRGRSARTVSSLTCSHSVISLARVGQLRYAVGKRSTKRLQPALARLVVGTLMNDVRHLPVLAIDQRERKWPAGRRNSIASPSVSRRPT
jgi:hypothetical protein